MESLQASSGGELAGKYLTFSLVGERYGIEILKVQEILSVPRITRVPRSLNFVKGVTNLRGKIIPLVDLRLKFALPERQYDDKTCIIVVNISRAEQTLALGIIVDTVLDVIDFQAVEIEPPPNYGATINTDFILGMGRKPGADLNILIDIQSVLSNSELAATATLEG
jgi:purine-binding chemotaxis protein CheW